MDLILHEQPMPDDFPVTEATIAAAIAARDAEREEARKAAAALGWDLRFDTDGRPFDASEEPKEGQ